MLQCVDLAENGFWGQESTTNQLSFQLELCLPLWLAFLGAERFWVHWGLVQGRCDCCELLTQNL